MKFISFFLFSFLIFFSSQVIASDDRLDSRAAGTEEAREGDLANTSEFPLLQVISRMVLEGDEFQIFDLAGSLSYPREEIDPDSPSVEMFAHVLLKANSTEEGQGKYSLITCRKAKKFDKVAGTLVMSAGSDSGKQYRTSDPALCEEFQSMIARANFLAIKTNDESGEIVDLIWNKAQFIGEEQIKRRLGLPERITREGLSSSADRNYVESILSGLIHVPEGQWKVEARTALEDLNARGIITTDAANKTLVPSLQFEVDMLDEAASMMKSLMNDLGAIGAD